MKTLCRVFVFVDPPPTTTETLMNFGEGLDGSDLTSQVPTTIISGTVYLYANILPNFIIWVVDPYINFFSFSTYLFHPDVCGHDLVLEVLQRSENGEKKRRETTDL